MPQTYIWIHAVWTTKNKYPFLEKEWRGEVFKKISVIAASKKIFLDRVNGYNDHIHCLINLHPTQSLAKVIKDIKGASSYWINTQGYTKSVFRWQKEYYAISVSKSVVDIVRAYIDNQEVHHREKDFEEERRENQWRL